MAKNLKIVLLEHRPDYTALYGLNLNIYLGLEVVVCNTIKNVLVEIKSSETHLVFIDNSAYSKDVGFELNEIFLHDNYKIPIFILGDTATNPSEVEIFDQKIELKFVLQRIADSLGVTARKMADKIVPKYFPLPIHFIVPGWECAADIYVENNQDYEIIFKQDSFFSFEILEKLEFEGQKNLFVEAEKRLRFVNCLTGQIIAKLDDPNLSVEDRTKTTATAFQMVTNQARKIGISETTLELSKKCMESMMLLVEMETGLQGVIDRLMKQTSSYFYKRSQLICFIGIHIIKKMPWGMKEHYEKYTFMAFFHDISLTTEKQVKLTSDEDIDKSDLTEKEKTLVRSHALVSAKMVSKIKKMPFDITSLIKQHHGSKSGSSISDISLNISPLAIVFIFAEEWTRLILDNEDSSYRVDKNKAIAHLSIKWNYPAYRKVIPILYTLDF
ncbi:hypothetical protein OAB57_00180 [Bacteriovoracaceae bacterium]|nr:hypothetical protein [Bacteriovoracaceae bacterium]